MFYYSNVNQIIYVKFCILSLILFSAGTLLLLISLIKLSLIKVFLSPTIFVAELVYLVLVLSFSLNSFVFFGVERITSSNFILFFALLMFVMFVVLELVLVFAFAFELN